MAIPVLVRRRLASGRSPQLVTSLEILKSFSPGIEEFIKEQGKLPPLVEAEAQAREQFQPGFANAVRFVKEFIENSVLAKSEAKKIIEETEDEEDLSDEDLELRLAAFQEFKRQPPEPAASPFISEEKFKKDFVSTLGDLLGQNPDLATASISQREDAANQAFINLQRGDEPNAIQGVFNALGKLISAPSGSQRETQNDILSRIAQTIVPEFRNRLQSGVFTVQPTVELEPEVQANIGRITQELQNRLSAQRELETKRLEEEGFLARLPKELKTSREELFAGERQRVIKQFGEEIVPAIRERLATRGLAQAGEFGALTAEATAGIRGQLESAELTAEQEDIDFFTQAAYTVALDRALKTSEEIRSQVSFQSQLGRQRQETAFRSFQESLNRQLEFELTRRGAQQATIETLGQLRTQREQGKQQTKQQTLLNIGQDIGTATGTGLGLKFLG